MALNLFTTSIAYIIGLACSSVIKDPYLTWDFGGPCIAGGILTVVFYFTFRHIDKEEYTVSQSGDYHLTTKKPGDLPTETVLVKLASPTLAVTESEKFGISPKN